MGIDFESDSSEAEPKGKEWDDSTKMPFGKYQGQVLSEIPASYFHWLWFNGAKDETGTPLHSYIKRNISCFEKENGDLIWN